jgi:hypothetical protein
VTVFMSGVSPAMNLGLSVFVSAPLGVIMRVCMVKYTPDVPVTGMQRMGSDPRTSD